MPLARWSQSVRATAERCCKDLLVGRGEGPDIWTEGGLVLHLRRRVSDLELASLPAWWVAIPPVDIG